MPFDMDVWRLLADESVQSTRPCAAGHHGHWYSSAVYCWVRLEDAAHGQVRLLIWLWEVLGTALMQRQSI